MSPRAERELAALGITADDPLLAAAAQAADPDLALAGLASTPAHRRPRPRASRRAATADLIRGARDDPASVPG